MSYKPFSEIGKGDIFSMVDKADISLMKTGDDRAILLKGYWDGDKLHSRGDMVLFNRTTCVLEQTDNEHYLASRNVDPIDPRRKFWQPGDQLAVGKNREAKINVFAGLFVYHGFGMGSYYSKSSNEIKGGTAGWARDRAQEEGIPFVQYDSFQWTSDPTLSHERARAWEDFESSKRAAEQSLTNALTPQHA